MKIHCIGIGGIGVSSLAQYYLGKGHQISGSDLVASEITDFLQKKGIRIFIGNDSKHITEDMDLIVYSPAVKEDNPEIVQAKSYNLKTKSYPEALGELTREHFTIAISGSHGKSTTTAMAGLLLERAGLDPTVIIGTKLKEFGNSNFRMGHSKYLVIEACEYDGSFLNYNANVVVITNVDKEHLDYFRTFANAKRAFKSFALKLPKDGFLVVNKDDKEMPKFSAEHFGIRAFSLRQKEAKKLQRILQIPGKHNVSNALAALAVARVLGVPDKTSFASLSEYQGSWRRFEVKEGKAGSNKIAVISDYGHHPSEVRATLKATREKYPNKKLWLIFQPHQHQRTYYLFKDFVMLFKKAPIDHILITDIYDVAGREEKAINKKVDSQMLVQKIGKKNVQYFSMSDAEKHVKEQMKLGEVLLIMGAGNIYTLFDNF